jgi:hypothetical protein
MRRRSPSLFFLILGLVLPLSLIPACGDDGHSTKPPDPGTQHLAGGGRNQGDAPFAGGPEDSGPTRPDFEYPDPGYVPLFYSDIDCQESPSQHVIRSQPDWEAWWTAATACMGGGGGEPMPPDDPTPPDSLYPYPGAPPVVDFDRNVVLVISLAPEEEIGRGIWVTEVVTTEAGTTVRFQVSQLGDDCFVTPDSPGAGESSPTIAVMVPRPVVDPVAWDREDIVFDCSWEPDPNTPLALYYTDAPCDLGAGEVVIRDADQFEAWLNQALECDRARWGEYDSTSTEPGRPPKGYARFGGGDPDSVPGEPPVPPPSWIGIDVDFTKYAVLILRADPQSRWGGGIWLDGIRSTDSGTAIDYTVMEPAGECPPTDGEILQPTVAIRVPLPLAETLTWNRRTETIECGWRDGGPGTGTGPRPR